MKKLKTTALALGLVLLLAGTTTVRAQDYDDGYQDTYGNESNVSLQNFYDELSPYGTWIQDPQYGYVWRPDVDQRTFRPYYTEGRWAMTEYGNTWVSNYDWGWAPFHYGRWVYNNYRQWIWLPGTTWGPAWVNWRSGGGYYGWAPMGPSININIRVGRRYVLPTYCWNFIPQGHIYNNYYQRYDYGRNNVYIRNTTIINNTYVYNSRTYYSGPSRYDVRRATNRAVTVYRVDRSDRPGASVVNNNNVEIYRPRPSRGGSNANAAPNNYQRGNVATINSGSTNRPERGAVNSNQAIDGRNSGSAVRGSSDQNNRGNTAISSRPQRGGNVNASPSNNGNVMERNPRAENGISSAVGQNNNRPNRGSEVTDQRAPAENIRSQSVQPQDRRVNQPTDRPNRNIESTNQNSNAEALREQQAQTQKAQQEQAVQQQRVQRAQQEQASQVQRDAQAQQQRAQRAQQEQAAQSQRQEQARQQQAQQQAERPQRVQRTEAPRQEAPARRAEAPAQRTGSSSSGSRPSRGG